MRILTTRFRLPLAAAMLAVLTFAFVLVPAQRARADEGWVITSFDATYVIYEDATVDAVEDIRVDFGGLQKHGVFRDIPVEYEYDDDHNRLIRLTDIVVDDGERPQRFEVFDDGPNLRIRIGDPDALISGPQRYRIRYKINRGLNPFDDHDEFYWNVTGGDWPVRIENATAQVHVASPAVQRVACYEGPSGSSRACASSDSGELSATFSAADLPEGSGLTIVVGLEKGAIAIGPPELVDAGKAVGEKVRDFLGLSPLPIGASIALLAAVVMLVSRQWWIAGRDRWYGDMFHVADTRKSAIKPLGAHESIVTEFTPASIDGKMPGRRMLPAEVGLLVDERADTLDVTATIVDLAVRKYVVIKETEEGGVFGLFEKKDYELTRISDKEDGLLPYEKKLLEGLFGHRTEVRLSGLKTKFHEHLAKVKELLYDDLTSDLKFFPRDPDTTRNAYLVAGILIAGIGGIFTYLLGAFFGAAVIGIPMIVAGVLLVVLAPAMPRRSADGRVMYRRCLGFRHYIETAETARQEFAEKANLFQEYLPYAIVFRCVDKWAKAFEGLDDQSTQPGWYYGRHPFAAAAFASSLNNFSESISSVMASTPGGSGSSGFGGGGFSGGGFSGGGGGGGGGGSW